MRGWSFSVAVMDLFAILLLLLLFVATVVLTSSCSGLTIVDAPEEPPGSLRLSFVKEFGETPLVKSGGATLDTNNFILKITKNSGEVIYNGKYGERGGEIKLSAGSYQVEISSSIFLTPTFDFPLYSDNLTVVMESGKSTKLYLMCRFSNCAVKLTFTQQFKERFSSYSTVIAAPNGRVSYPYNEGRYLFIEPGEILIKMKGASDSFLLAKRVIKPAEMVLFSLHSSLPTQEPGGGSNNSDGSIFSSISVDTSSVRYSEELIIGERRDGSSKELALSIEDLESFIGHKGVWVSGYIVGTFASASSLTTIPPFGSDTNIALNSKKGEGEGSIAVALPAGDIRASLNLKSNPLNCGKKVWIKGSVVASYFGGVGVNPISAFSFE